VLAEINYGKIMISADEHELSPNLGSCVETDTKHSRRSKKISLIIDAVSLTPSAHFNKNGELENVYEFEKPESGEVVLKTPSYMYSFLAVPLEADDDPHFLCGLLST